MGPGCRKRSLLLSLAKQSAAASRSAISSRCRSMQLTIAKTDRDVLQMLALVSWLRDCYYCRCQLAGGEPGVPARLNGRDARPSTVMNCRAVAVLAVRRTPAARSETHVNLFHIGPDIHALPPRYDCSRCSGPDLHSAGATPDCAWWHAAGQARRVPP